MQQCVSPYSIRRVDGDDEADTIHELHRATSEFPDIDPGNGWWWFAYFDDVPVAYAGIIQSTVYTNAAYFTRVGVLPAHRGNNLQFRLMRVMERYARRSGFEFMISDTTHTVHSANNFVKAGWRMFDPVVPWAFADTLYWRKDL